MRNSSEIYWQRSTSRQRTTPWTAGMGPSSIALATAARCAWFNREAWPGAFFSLRPSIPWALNFKTRSCTFYKVTPPIFDASVRVVQQLRQKIERSPDEPRYITTETGSGYRLREAE